MDFSPAACEATAGRGRYTSLDPALLPPLHLIYRWGGLKGWPAEVGAMAVRALALWADRGCMEAGAAAACCMCRLCDQPQRLRPCCAALRRRAARTAAGCTLMCGGGGWRGMQP